MKKESMRMKKDIRAYEYEELQKELERLGEKPFRAKQIYEWLHVKLADRFDEMTNLSVKLREKLAEEYDIFPVQMAERQQSAFGRVYGYSVLSIFLFHLFINIGMVLGLTPVIGIPLPFFSYGGSSLWGFTILLFIFLRIDAGRNRRLV